MKKSYSLLLASMCAVATSFASSPVVGSLEVLETAQSPNIIVANERMSTEDLLESMGLDVKNPIKLDPAKVANFKKNIRKAPAAREDGVWEDLGVTTIEDGLLWTLLYVDNPADMYSREWPVGIAQYSNSPIYAVTQPYYKNPVNGWMGGTVIQYESVAGDYRDQWFIDATNPLQVETDLTYTGMNVLYSQIGHVFFMPADVAKELGANVEQIFGTLTSGTVTFPVGSLYYWLPEYKGYESNLFRYKYPTSVKLPVGAAPTVEINVPYCIHENEATIEFNIFGDNVVKTYIGLYGFEMPDAQMSKEWYDKVLKEGTPVDRNAFKMTLNTNGIQNGHHQIYTIIAVAVNENNEVVASKNESFYILPNDNENWIRLDGKGRMVDNIIAGYFTQYTNEQLICSVDVHKDNPGFYRLVNPYTDSSNRTWKYASQNESKETHDHYIYVDATDPDKVILEESPLGVDFGEGEMRVISLPYNYKMAGQTPQASHYGKKTGNNITFPASTIYIAEKNYKDNAWMVTNKKGLLQITVPNQNAVEGIATDANNAAPEYFNLQGVRVSNPTPGQMMIVRRGENVTKELVM